MIAKLYNEDIITKRCSQTLHYSPLHIYYNNIYLWRNLHAIIYKSILHYVIISPQATLPLGLLNLAPNLRRPSFNIGQVSARFRSDLVCVPTTSVISRLPTSNHRRSLHLYPLQFVT